MCDQITSSSSNQPEFISSCVTSRSVGCSAPDDVAPLSAAQLGCGDFRAASTSHTSSSSSSSPCATSLLLSCCRRLRRRPQRLLVLVAAGSVTGRLPGSRPRPGKRPVVITIFLPRTAGRRDFTAADDLLAGAGSSFSASNTCS